MPPEESGTESVTAKPTPDAAQRLEIEVRDKRIASLEEEVRNLHEAMRNDRSGQARRYETRDHRHLGGLNTSAFHDSPSHRMSYRRW